MNPCRPTRSRLRIQRIWPFRFNVGIAFLCWVLASGALGKASAATQESQPQPERSGQRVLRISADPNNLPFTNEKLEGFENKIAEIIAQDLNARIEYTWRAQRRGFFRQSLKENRADLVLGVPKGFEMALSTEAYYCSAYVFVSRKDRKLNIKSLDDPALKSLKIGVQLVGDDGSNPPAAHALGRRGLVDNIVGFTVYGNYQKANPPARIVEAVAKGEIDLAIVWVPWADILPNNLMWL